MGGKVKTYVDTCMTNECKIFDHHTQRKLLEYSIDFRINLAASKFIDDLARTGRQSFILSVFTYCFCVVAVKRTHLEDNSSSK